MSRAATLMTEDDERGADIDRAPNPFQGSVVDLPGNGASGDDAGDDGLTIIETDDDFKPIQNGEGRLSEDEGGERTLLDQRRTDEQGQQDGSRRGETRAERRKRQKDGRERTLRENAGFIAEIAELRARLDGFEPRISDFDRSRVQDQIAGVEREIESVQTQFRSAEAKVASALRALAQGEEGAEQAFTEGQRERDGAFLKGQQLLVRKNMLTTGTVDGSADPARHQQQTQRQPAQQQDQVQQRQAPMRPAVQSRIQEFQSDNPWFTTDMNDLDSNIARAVDLQVQNDGFDPATDDYWDELEDRLRVKMPYKFADEQQDGQRQRQVNGGRQPAPQRQQPAPQRRGPMVSGGGDRPAAAGKNQVYLSPQRKEAMKLAGCLDQDGVTVLDKGKFQRTLKAYADHDRTNGAARA